MAFVRHTPCQNAAYLQTNSREENERMCVCFSLAYNVVEHACPQCEKLSITPRSACVDTMRHMIHICYLAMSLHLDGFCMQVRTPRPLLTDIRFTLNVDAVVWRSRCYLCMSCTLYMHQRRSCMLYLYVL